MKEIVTGDEFHHGQVRVKCRLPIQILQELEIVRKPNEHGVLIVKGILDENGRDAIPRVGSKEPIVVYGKKEAEEIILFSGVISETKVSFKDGISYITIKGLSWSSLLDYGEKSRSFQNKAMTYSAVVDSIIQKYSDSMCLYDPAIADQSIGQFILQYRETDWEFCKRLATHFYTCLIPDVSGKSPRFRFGLSGRVQKISNIEEVVVKREAALKYQIHAQVHLELGALVEYDNQRLIVEECHIYLRRGILCFTYILAEEISLAFGMTSNEKIKGVSLLGTVLDRENQKIKIKLAIDQEQDKDTACWFPYASLASNLFYCMPEVGTSVSLLFPTTQEADAIAMNAVRRNGGNCAKTSNPQMKYMGIPEGKEFKLGITDMDFTAHEKLFLSLDDERGVSVHSNENVNVFTRQKLFMEAKELIKIFSVTGNIIVGAKDKSSLYLLGGPDGDTHIKAGNHLLYEGRKKEIFTERLNSEIAYEEKKMEWGKLVRNVLIGLAVVAAVALVVATGGAALVACGAVAASTVSAAVSGAIASGVIAVGVMAASDIMKGEVSDWQDYALAGLKGSIDGAISGAFLGTEAFKGAKLITKMIVSGSIFALTDGIGQGIDYAYSGKAYDFKQGLLSFGMGFAMPAFSHLFEKGINKLISKYGEKMSDWYCKGLCKLKGEPVDVINGNVLYDVVDFTLPGPIPFQWKRIWSSFSQMMGHLGHGTRYSYEMGLESFEEEHQLIAFLNDGRVCAFPQIMVGEEIFDYKNKLMLKRCRDCYQLFDPESRYIYTLSAIDKGYIAYKLTKVENKMGHRICFAYDTRGYLCKITDSAGRDLSVNTNEDGRITDVYLQEGKKQHLLVSYTYNKEQDLIGVTDAMGKTSQMNYRNHLLIKKLDREKNAFFWEYDKYEDGARAIRSWGDGDVLSFRIYYHDNEMYNEVKGSKNKKAHEYHYDENKLCTRIVYPDLTETREMYDDKYRRICFIDEEGRKTDYRYNELSLLSEIILADASKIQFVYDKEGRLIKRCNPEGDSVEWVYHENDTLYKSIDEFGTETTYEYNRDKLIEKVRNVAGEEITIAYDQHKNLNRVVLPNGCTSEWEYDYQGNCLSYKSPLGAVERYSYDQLNRLIHAKLADGNEVVLKYNAYEDIVYAKDKNTEVTFTYNILGKMTSRTEGKRKQEYQYDREGQLIAIINERGDAYKLERDVKGNVIKEIGYDKQVRTYELDYSGLVKKIKRAGGRFTKYTYDKLCRTIRADYYDRSYEEFTYNKNGLLTGIKNQHTTINLELDKSGRVQKEWQDTHWVSSAYDVLGNRTEVSSSFGANIVTEHDKMGQITQMTAYLDKKTPWVSQTEYNAIGQEVLRQVSGGIINRFAYDTVGRPIEQTVSAGQNGFQCHYQYDWDVNLRLKKRTDKLKNRSTSYSYNQSGNLISAKGEELLSIFRSFDETDNLYAAEDNSDRIYGAGGRLEKAGIDLKEKRNAFQGGYGRLVTKGTEYSYDEEGNLIQKAEADGSTWEYSYYGNGMLRKVVRPDRSAVLFKYDGLGRRIEKCVTTAGSERLISPKAQEESKAGSWETIGGVRIRKPVQKKEKPKAEDRDSQPLSVERIVRFLWDGTSLLHEWEIPNPSQQKPVHKIDYQAEYVMELEAKKNRECKEKAAKGEPAPDSLITWIFQDDFIPRAKLTKEGCYSIITDYLGTPTEAYDEAGKLVWERKLDINGKVMPAGKDTHGEKTFIPFRFQGQYEDEEIDLYYNRFRYYDPQTGQYTQQDPIGLAGGNPTLYGYVYNTLGELDPFGLVWGDLFGSGQGHHIFPIAIAKKLKIPELMIRGKAISWYPNITAGSGAFHQRMHQALSAVGLPYRGSKFTGTIEDVWEMLEKGYDIVEGENVRGYLKIPGCKENYERMENLTPKEAVLRIKELYEEGKLSICKS